MIELPFMNISFLRNAQAEEKEEMSYFCMHAPAADGHAAAQRPGAGSGAPAAAAPHPPPRAHPAAAATPKASGGARPYTAPPCQSSGSTKARGLILPRDAAGAPKTMRGGQRLSPPQGNGERGQNEATLAPKGATRTTRLPPQPRLPSTHRLRAKHRDVASPKAPPPASQKPAVGTGNLFGAKRSRQGAGGQH